jgi:dTDP-4-amino-4,6-dideoxygalactose transaminase
VPAIPFNRPYAGRRAAANVEDALRSAHHSGDGPWCEQVAERLSPMVGGGRVFLTPSGTDALELSCMALGLGPGDEVIVPSFTFSSTATAVQRTGATVRFADVDPVTLSMGAAQVAERVTTRTRAVIAVHYGGQSSSMAELSALCDAHGLTLVEDAAHALGGTHEGRAYGSFGALACLSFHETKNLSSGEGGALVVNDPRLYERVEQLREKGTDRSKFFRGQVDKYTWVSPGSSFLLGDLLAAVLAAGLDDWDLTQARRHAAWDAYESRLASFATDHDITLQPRLPDTRHPAHLYYLLAPSGQDRDDLLAHCRLRHVLAVSHYQPLAESAEGRRASRPYADECPVTTDVSARLLRLPLYGSMTDDEVDTVIATVRAWATDRVVHA